MPRQFLTRQETDEHDAIVEAVAGRENELASYDNNVTGYEKQIAVLNSQLPAEWPETLLKFKGKSNEQIYIMDGTDADKQLASSLNHRERVKMLLFTEKAERAKSELAYNHCLDCLPKDNGKKKAAFDRYQTKLAAQKAKGL